MIKRFLFFIISANIVISCRPKLEFQKGDLLDVGEITYSYTSDTLSVQYIDNSLMLFEEYNAIKNNVFAYNNKDVLKNYEHIQIAGLSKAQKVFSKSYHQKDLKFVDSLYQKNMVFRDYAIHISSKFNITDWWNLNGALEFTNKNIGQVAEDPIDLLFNFSMVNPDSLESSAVYERIVFIGEMINETGVTDAFTEKRGSSKEFMEKYNYFLERKGLKLIE